MRPSCRRPRPNPGSSRTSACTPCRNRPLGSPDGGPPSCSRTPFRGRRSIWVPEAPWGNIRSSDTCPRPRARRGTSGRGSRAVRRPAPISLCRSMISGGSGRTCRNGRARRICTLCTRTRMVRDGGSSPCSPCGGFRPACGTRFRPEVPSPASQVSSGYVR